MKINIKCAVVFVLSFATVPNQAQAFAPVSISISETGTPPVWTVAVDGRFRLFQNIELPDGMVLPAVDHRPPSADRIPAGDVAFEQTFDTLDSALSFVAGDWAATEVTSRFPDSSETIRRQFSVSPLTADDLNQSLPVISSPEPGFAARSGETFLLAWDFETPSDDMEAPNASILRSRRTVPEDTGSSTSIFSTPSGRGASRSAGGSPEFFTTRHNEPNADSNRWLFSAKSNEPFPQTFELHVGSWVPLDEFIDTPTLDPDGTSSPFARLAYSRFAEPLSIDLVSGSAELGCVIPAAGILGDFDGNGTVDFTDFLTLSSNIAQIVTTYEEGDADCNNVVNFEDFLVVSQNFGLSAATATEAAPVPEPSTIWLTICCVGAIIGLNRYQRNSRRVQ